MNAPQVILIVDDTPDNILIINSLLKGIYKTKVATNGAKALKIAQSAKPPDLILLDIMMPEMDGYEVCRQLKAMPATAAIPVVFLTAKDGAADQAQGLALGAVGYIKKPVEPQLLLTTVATHLA